MRTAAKLLVSLCLSALASVAAADAAQTAAAESRPAYRLQPGDVVAVSVWKETDLQREVLVRPDGALSFPLAGEINVDGKTVEELRVALAERLKRFVPDPVVTVAVKQIGGNRIYVLGKVLRPGEFPFSSPVDVMQALSLAGGATSFAQVNDIVILRRENSGQRALPFRYGDVERGKNLQQNVLLQSGDTVVVP
ncbi:MAG TPA: polysaccharide biosynthesis/export family protein [Steroidobacteraceae bacterium]|nr:polysaccharide biosynthesis/export family protein [Steroidobacteraceae bacterium]